MGRVAEVTFHLIEFISFRINFGSIHNFSFLQVIIILHIFCAKIMNEIKVKYIFISFNENNLA